MVEETKQAEETQEGSSGITAADLALMVQVIDAGSQRGAWRGEELATVGSLRNKLAAIVKSLNPQTEEVTEEVPTAANATKEDVPANTSEETGAV